MKSITLNATKAGMTRMREKGGASPETLYELTNAFVTASKAPRQRPGTTFKFELPPNTKGLCAFRGVFHVFSASVVASLDPTHYVVDTLRHPEAGFSGHLKDIHFAAPVQNRLYVVAEFDDGQIFHYWMQEPDAWVPNHAYLPSDIVQPTVPNGYYYRPSTDLTPPAWSPGVKRAVGDVVQPTTTTGWMYTVTSTTGDSPRSGDDQPEWPTTVGATVVEYVEAGPPPPAPGAPAPPSGDPNDGRYGNPGGSGMDKPPRPRYYNTLQQ